MAGAIKFGTDGWRAVIAEDYTFDNVRLCAQGLATYLHGTTGGGRSVVVGYDTRFASEDFAAATAEVLGANGVHVYLCTSAVPTPVVSHAVATLKAHAGVVITASHNPARWNGFKIKGPDGSSAPMEIITKVEAEIASLQRQAADGASPVAREALAELVERRTVEWHDPTPAYFTTIGRLVDIDTLKTMAATVVIDSMFGAGSGFFARLLDGGKLHVNEINGERNPAFPGIRPEPIGPNLERLMKRVPATGAVMGIATDGDADRVGIVDEHGAFLNQHQVFALLCYYLLELRADRGDIVRSLTTTEMISLLGTHYNVPVHVTQVGFKYIAPLMATHNALIGGEESGGYAFRGHVPERDGILAGLYFLDMVRRSGKTPSALLRELYGLVGPHYYDRIDLELEQSDRARVSDMLAALAPDAVGGTQVERVDRTDGVMLRLQDGSWVLYRLSGTEPLVRIYSEADSTARVQELLAAGRSLLRL
jgi:phosphomannomutase